MSEFLGGVLSQGPMIQESVMVDLTDIDIRKRRKINSLDNIDGEDFIPTVSEAPSFLILPEFL